MSTSQVIPSNKDQTHYKEFLNNQIDDKRQIKSNNDQNNNDSCNTNNKQNNNNEYNKIDAQEIDSTELPIKSNISNKYVKWILLYVMFIHLLVLYAVIDYISFFDDIMKTIKEFQTRIFTCYVIILISIAFANWNRQKVIFVVAVMFIVGLIFYIFFGIIEPEITQLKNQVFQSQQQILYLQRNQNKINGEVDIIHNTIQQNSVLPKGAIIFLSVQKCELQYIPAGWQLCDGTGGSPDVRGKIIIGADDNIFKSGDIGGRLSDDNRGLYGTCNIDEWFLSIDQLPQFQTNGGPANKIREGHRSNLRNAGEPKKIGQNKPIKLNAKFEGTLPPYHVLCCVMST